VEIPQGYIQCRKDCLVPLCDAQKCLKNFQKKTRRKSLCRNQKNMTIETTGVDGCRSKFSANGVNSFYKRTAKPKNTLPNRAARPRPAFGMKIVPVLPLLEDESLVPVGAAPPKPVTGMAFVAEPEGAAVEAMVVGRVVFPLKGDWAPQGWS